MVADARSAMILTEESVTGVTLLKVDGILDTTTYLPLRDGIIKAALAEPSAVIVDVTGLTVPASSALAVFTSARWHVGTWPEIPIALVCASPAGRDALTRNGVTRYVPVYADVDDAILATSQRDARRCRRRARGNLPADMTSLVRSRRLVESWLSAWSLEELTPVAKIIVTTLVENVLQHTNSAPNIRLETDGRNVTVAVEDGSHRLAELPEGTNGRHRPSGLNIVAALSRIWGNAPTSSGKTVWAVLGPENRL
jgi:anti-anti-sigma regulatory factor